MENRENGENMSGCACYRYQIVIFDQMNLERYGRNGKSGDQCGESSDGEKYQKSGYNRGSVNDESEAWSANAPFAKWKGEGEGGMVAVQV